jgi:endoglucanase
LLGNNYNGILPIWDENIVLSFHKYWNYNDQAAIQTMLDYRTKYNVPIWLGESGENSNVWFKDVITLVEKNNIGWAFWPMKKIENTAGVTSVNTTPEYEQLLDYWKNGGVKPTEAFAKKALLKIADNYKMENVTVKPDVIDAMFRQVQTDDTKPYKKHALPGKIFATEYDLGQNDMAYFDTDAVNYKVSTGTFEQWNKGNKMRNDGVDIVTCTDKTTNGFQISFIEDKEWLQFTYDLKNQSTFDVSVRYSSEKAGGKLYLEQDAVKISESVELPITGGQSAWKTITLKNVSLKQGRNKIRIHFESGNFNLNFLEFKKADK